MQHTDHHKDLLLALVLGDATPAETNEVAEYLETCEVCPTELERFKDKIWYEQPAEELEDVPVHTGVMIKGWGPDVNAVVDYLKGLLTSTMTLTTQEVRGGASGSNVENVVIIKTDEAYTLELQRLLEEFLKARRGDEESSRTTIQLGWRATGSPITPYDFSNATDEENVKDISQYLYINDGE